VGSAFIFVWKFDLHSHPVVENRLMSDTSPRDQAALRWDATRVRPTSPKRNPGERLFEFLVSCNRRK